MRPNFNFAFTDPLFKRVVAPVALILLSVFGTPAVFAQQCPPFQAGVQVGTVEDPTPDDDPSLSEISGVVVSRKNAGVLWVHNDHGDSARVFAMNAAGDHLGIYNLSGAQATDYEDIAIGPGPTAGTDYLYVSDTGDNSLERSTVTVYRVAEPVATSSQSPVNVNLSAVDAFPMTYPGTTKYDCETLLVNPANGDIYLVTRDRDGDSGNVSFVFRNPAPQAPNVTVELELITSFSAPIEIKGGDISPDGTQILLRPDDAPNSVDALWWPWDGAASLATVFLQPGCPVPAAAEPQGEAIAFAADGLSYYTISEGTEEPIYHYTLATPPAAPTSLAATAQSSAEISLAWIDNSNDEDGFEIYQSLDGTNFSLLTTTGPDATSHLAGGLLANTTYHYYVRAINVAGGADSILPDSASATTLALTVPIAPDALTAVAVSSSQIDLNWNDNSNNEEGFRIYESLDGSNFNLIFTTGPGATSGMVTGLLADSTYYYFVSAFNDAGETNSNPPASATTLPPGPTTLFSDGFESGGLVSGGWSIVSPASAASSAAYSGNYGALLKKSAAISKMISTGGATTIDISYRRSVSKLNNGEFFLAEYSLDGSTWTSIEPMIGGSAGWDLGEIQIVPTASTVHLRFSLSGNAGNDIGMVDEVLVTGAIGTPNTAPTAAADNYAVDEDSVLSEGTPGILGNDSDADEDVLTAVLVGGPGSGSLILDGEGSFTYTPDPDFDGVDSFTYLATDGLADSSPATVSITVNPIPDAPVASDDSYSTESYSSTEPEISLVVLDVELGVLANDTDADGGDLLSATLLSGPSNGSLSLALDGSFTYTPNPEFIGNDSFRYLTTATTAAGGNGGSDEAIVMIAVQPVAGPVSMHINSIVVNHISLGKGQKQGHAEVIVLDNVGNPVEGASVTGSFSEDINETLTVTTTASGLAVFDTSSTVKGSISLTFCVDDVTVTGLSYEATDNVEDCDTNY